MIEELTDIDDVGKKTAKKLKDAGIEDQHDILELDEDGIKDAIDCSDWKAGQIVENVRAESVIVRTGAERMEEYEQRTRINSGLERLDEIYDGGWDAGRVHGIAGASGTGKTQILFKSFARAVEETGETCVYIETEPDRYDGHRVQSFAEGDEELKESIRVLEAPTADKQYSSYNYLLNVIEDREGIEDIGLIVIDSFNGPMRDSGMLGDLSDLGDRNKLILKHMKKIDQLMEEYECPVLLSLQIYDDSGGYVEKRQLKEGVIWGSNQMEHWLFSVIGLSGGQGDKNTTATIRNHPSVGPEQFDIAVTDTNVKTKDPD